LHPPRGIGLSCTWFKGRCHSLGQIGIRKEVQEELDAAGANWPPIKAGLFGGSLEKAKDVKNKFDEFVASLPFL
jgi:hypothetical protein